MRQRQTNMRPHQTTYKAALHYNILGQKYTHENLFCQDLICSMYYLYSYGNSVDERLNM